VQKFTYREMNFRCNKVNIPCKCRQQEVEVKERGEGLTKWVLTKYDDKLER